MIAKFISSGMPITGDVLVVNGMSIMLGYGATAGHSFTAELCAIKGWTEDNHAVSSTTIDYLLSNLSLIPAYNGTTHRNWILGETINDAGYRTSTPATYPAKLISLLTHVNSVKGWPKNRMYVIDGFYATSAGWADYAVTPVTTVAEYKDMIAASSSGCETFGGIHHMSLFEWMEANYDPTKMDPAGRHPNELFTPGMASFYAPSIR